MFKFGSICNFDKFNPRFDIEYIVLDKINGSNLSVYVDNLETKLFCRTHVTDGTFFNCQKVMNSYILEVEKLFNIIQSYPLNGIMGDEYIVSIQVCGELIGKGIGKRVYYCKKEWFVFDLLVNTNRKSFFVRYQHLLNILSQYDIKLKALPILLEGDYATCLEYCKSNINRNSQIPVYLGNEEISNNIEEGFIIKSAYSALPDSRSITKVKHCKFAEKISKESKTKEFTEEELNYLSYFNTNRFDNYRSKVGQLQLKEMRKIVEEIVEDVSLEVTPIDNKAVRTEIFLQVKNYIDEQNNS